MVPNIERHVIRCKTNQKIKDYRLLTMLKQVYVLWLIFLESETNFTDFRIIPNVHRIRLFSIGVSWGEATSIILGIHQRRGMDGERT